MAATNNNAKLLGKGGFGPVYYGKLPTGQEVAVKVSEKGSNQGSKEFINEVLIKLGLLTCCFQSRLPVDVTYSSLNC
jgi:predicted Ser/Thr protein kinase